MRHIRESIRDHGEHDRCRHHDIGALGILHRFLHHDMCQRIHQLPVAHGELLDEMMCHFACILLYRPRYSTITVQEMADKIVLERIHLGVVLQDLGRRLRRKGTLFRRSHSFKGRCIFKILFGKDARLFFLGIVLSDDRKDLCRIIDGRLSGDRRSGCFFFRNRRNFHGLIQIGHDGFCIFLLSGQSEYHETGDRKEQKNDPGKDQVGNDKHRCSLYTLFTL